MTLPEFTKPMSFYKDYEGNIADMNAPQDSSELPTAAQTLSSLAEVDIETAELFLEQTLAHFPSDASLTKRSCRRSRRNTKYPCETYFWLAEGQYSLVSRPRRGSARSSSGRCRKNITRNLDFLRRNTIILST